AELPSRLRTEHVPRFLALRCEHEPSLAVPELPAKYAGRRQILDRVEAALALALVEKVPVPDRLVLVLPIGSADDRRQIGIKAKAYAIARAARVKSKSLVLAHQAVKVAAREERAQREHALRGGSA